jgi:alkylation response protein AidB-like acyl-CoA dehydrogenase
MRWHRILAAQGWVAPAWPKEWGGTGWNVVQRYIFEEELGYAGAPPIIPFGINMCAPVLLAFGTEAQKKRFLPRIYHGEDFWCQGYSEPGSGSDLASLKTKAERRQDHYIVNGQKTWTSYAHYADWIFCLVRTDPTVEKRQEGISFLLVDMRSPGITVRPLRQMTGEAEFNEVFFDGVRVPAENLVGRLNEGWAVAITTLAYERDLLTFIRHVSLRTAVQRLVRLVQEHGQAPDRVVRQKVAGLWIGEQALQLNAYRSLTTILRGGQPGPEGSTSKLFWSQVDQELAQTATEVLGPVSQLTAGSRWALDEGQWEFYALLAQASGIRAGTSEILRNILSERVLGLPKD